LKKELLRQIILRINRFRGVQGLMYRVAFRTAPTILGLKPSVLLVLNNCSGAAFSLWEEHKEKICRELGLCFREIKKSPERATVLFYKPDILKRCLHQRENVEFLLKYGYTRRMDLNDKLVLLQERFQDGCPHEIGIFLGFPAEDVRDYITNKGTGALLCGYWKVYHDPRSALKVFRRFDLAKMMVILAMLDPG